MAVRVKCRHVVKPAEPTWQGLLPLSELDQIGAITQTTAIYFYNKPATQDWLDGSSNKVVETMKDALSRTLVPFYPLAGRLRWVDVKGGRLELECNAMGMELIEAECSLPMSFFGDFKSLSPPPCFKDFQGLIPEVDYTAKPMEELPLVFAQLTRFQCGGLGLGMSISHTVVDGQSAYHFTRECARLARGESLEALPFLDRHILQARHQKYSYANSLRKIPHVDDRVLVDHFSRLPTLIGEDQQGRKKNNAAKTIAATMLPLSRSQVQKLRKAANMGGGGRSVDERRRRPFGRFEVIAAHVWRCACKARAHKSEQLTALCFAVDARDRMDPPLPPRYFGNAIVDVVATSRAGDLNLRPLSHVCSRIREMIEKVTNEYVCSTIDFFKTQQCLSKYQDRVALGGTEGVCYGDPNIGVASWLNLPVRSLDFGWGKEIFMAPGCCEFDGDIMILPGYNDDGSVVVAVGLQALHMEKFKSYFYEDTDALDFGMKVVQEPFSIPSRI